MRFRIALFTCGLLLISGLAFLVYERNRYNVVSHVELLTIREKLKALSPQEKKDLTFFIGHVSASDQYPYTLVGYKPMSITHVLVEDTEDLPADSRECFKMPRNQTFRRGYLVWKKHQSLFPRKKQILIDYSFQGTGRKEVALICSKLYMATIQKHLDDFREILERPCTSEEVFWILTHPEHNDFYTLIDHARLMGILLGFGRNNACLYEQYRGETSRSAMGHPRPKPGPLQMFNKEWPWSGILRSPGFACDLNTKETQKLKKHYTKARRIVLWTYFLRNNLEVTLALLTQN